MERDEKNKIGTGYKFLEDQHVHTFDGKRMYGVTSVLKNWGDPSALVNWAANQAVDYIEQEGVKGENELLYIDRVGLEEARTAHTRKRDKAGDRGTEVHAQLELMMNDWIAEKEDFAIDEYKPIVKLVREWMFENGIKPLKSEMPVYSLNHFYAGIADGVIEKEGKKYILDFKTSGSIQTKYFFQLAAYSLAFREMTGEEIHGGVIVHIPKGTSFNVEKNIYTRYDVKELETSWLGILNTYKKDMELQKLIRY